MQHSFFITSKHLCLIQKLWDTLRYSYFFSCISFPKIQICAIVNGNIFKFCLNTLLGVHAKDLNWWNFFRMINFYVDKLNLFNFRIYISNLEFFPHLWTEFLIEYRTMLNASRSQTFVLLYAPLLPPGMPFLLLHSANFCSFADLIHMCPLSWGLRESSPLHLWDCACTLFVFP